MLDSHLSLAILLIKRGDIAMSGESAQREGSMTATYLTTDELSAKIKYDVRTIRERLKDSVLIEGRHYGLGRSAGVDRSAAGPHQHRDAVPHLQPLCPEPDPPRRLGLRASARLALQHGRDAVAACPRARSGP